MMPTWGGVADPDVLALAAAQDRVLVSHDLKTMPRHLGDFLQAHGFSPGLIIVPQHMPIGQAAHPAGDRGARADLGRQ